MLYFLLGFVFGVGFLLALYLTARAEHVRQQARTESISKEKSTLLNFLHSLFECIARGLPVEQIYQHVVSGCRLTVHGISACFFKYDENANELVPVAKDGLFPLLKTQLSDGLSKAEMLAATNLGERFFMGEGWVGKCAQRLRTYVLNSNDLETLVVNAGMKWRIKQLLISPIIFKGDLLGVIAIANSTQIGGFSAEACSLLESVCEQAGVVLNNARLLSLLFEQNQLKFDLNLAKQIQNFLLPDLKYTNTCGLDMCIAYKPSRVIGGDLYDVFELSENRKAIVIGDVSGKSVAAALIMANCLAHLKHFVNVQQKPSEVLKNLNQMLYGTLPDNMFVSMIFMIIDTDNNCIELARAGHEYPLLMHAGEVVRMKSQGMALGLMPAELFDMDIEDARYSFVEGDTCVLFTDGLTETKNKQKLEFGNNNLIQSLQSHAGFSASVTNECILNDVQRFSQKSEFDDDLTLITLKRVS